MVDFADKGFFKDGSVITLIGDYNAPATSQQILYEEIQDKVNTIRDKDTRRIIISDKDIEVVSSSNTSFASASASSPKPGQRRGYFSSEGHSTIERGRNRLDLVVIIPVIVCFSSPVID